MATYKTDPVRGHQLSDPVPPIYDPEDDVDTHEDLMVAWLAKTPEPDGEAMWCFRHDEVAVDLGTCDLYRPARPCDVALADMYRRKESE